MTTPIQNEVMRLKDLKQLLCKINVEFSSPVNGIAFRFDSAFWLKDKITTFVIELQLAIHTIVALGTEKLYEK